MVWRGANKNFFAGGGVWYLTEGWKYFKKGCSTREELKKMDGWGCDPPKKLCAEFLWKDSANFEVSKSIIKNGDDASCSPPACIN